MIESNVVEQIPSNKHVLVCGMTGTGKSFLTEQYTKGYKYVVKLDTKGETDERKAFGQSAWDGLRENVDFTICRHLQELDEIDTPKIIYVPDFEEQNEQTFDAFFKWIFERGNTILWIDELMSVGTVFKYPRNLKRIYTQGRSKNVGVWACTQRPTGIPDCSLSNSHYFFVFDMSLKADRKKMAECTGVEELQRMPNGYNFWYYKLGNRQAVKACLQL